MECCAGEFRVGECLWNAKYTEYLVWHQKIIEVPIFKAKFCNKFKICANSLWRRWKNFNSSLAFHYIVTTICLNHKTYKGSPMGADGEKKVFLQIRVGKGLKRDFERACKDNDLTASQVLRAHMRDFVKQYLGETEAEDKPQGKAKDSTKSKGDGK